MQSGLGVNAYYSSVATTSATKPTHKAIRHSPGKDSVGQLAISYSHIEVSLIHAIEEKKNIDSGVNVKTLQLS